MGKTVAPLVFCQIIVIWCSVQTGIMENYYGCDQTVHKFTPLKTNLAVVVVECNVWLFLTIVFYWESFKGTDLLT